ncbi:MAG: hypothetical protein AAGF59_14445 [Pseudomonadota bacterium]
MKAADMSIAGFGGSPVNLPVGIDDSFRYWRGASGARYLFTEIPPHQIQEYRETVIMVVDSRRRAAPKLTFLGEVDEAGSNHAAALARHRPTLRAFVHLLADDPARRREIIDDLSRAAA